MVFQPPIISGHNKKSFIAKRLLLTHILTFIFLFLNPEMINFTIYGAVHAIDVFFCEAIANKISSKVDCKIEMNVMFEVDYLIKIHELTKQHSKLMHHKGNSLVFRNGDPIGNTSAFIELATTEYNIEDAEAANTVVYNRFVRETSERMLKERGHPVVYMEFADSGSKPSDAIKLGVLQIELFEDLCPQAVRNFTLLCEGSKVGENFVHYKGSIIHRLVKNGWIQCGDIIDGSGLNSIAALNEANLVPDESFSLDFGFHAGGIIGFANSGSHSNGSQFFITMGPCEWMNHNYVGIGRILQGYNIIHTLNQLNTSNQRPVKAITIQNCGITPTV